MMAVVSMGVDGMFVTIPVAVMDRSVSGICVEFWVGPDFSHGIGFHPMR